jgi:integral membrane protein
VSFESGGFTLGNGLLDHAQPPVPAATVARVKTNLRAYRVMAFVTGVVLITATIALILKYATSWDMEPGTGYLWIAHGWCYFVYVLVTVSLGWRLRWPPLRFVLVLLAGTIPTMSFVAEHVVTRALRDATTDQPVPARD